MFLSIFVCFFVFSPYTTLQTCVVKYLQINDHHIFLGKGTFRDSMASCFLPGNGHSNVLWPTLGLSAPIAHPSAGGGQRQEIRWEGTRGGRLDFPPVLAPHLQAKCEGPGAHCVGTLSTAQTAKWHLTAWQSLVTKSSQEKPTCVPRVERLKRTLSLEGLGRWHEEIERMGRGGSESTHNLHVPGLASKGLWVAGGQLASKEGRRLKAPKGSHPTQQPGG